MGKTTKRRGRTRWIALGVLVGVIAAWGGFGMLGAATPTITTCTKKLSGATKVIPATSAAKCNYKGKGTAATWVPASAIADLQRYHDLLKGSTQCGGTTNDFRAMDLTGVILPWCMAGARFDGSLFTNADLSGDFLPNTNLTDAHFSNTDFTGAYLVGAVATGATTDFAHWDTTFCPDGSRSDTNGTHPESCVGHGF